MRLHTRVISSGAARPLADGLRSRETLWLLECSLRSQETQGPSTALGMTAQGWYEEI